MIEIVHLQSQPAKCAQLGAERRRGCYSGLARPVYLSMANLAPDNNSLMVFTTGIPTASLLPRKRLAYAVFCGRLEIDPGVQAGSAAGHIGDW